MDKSLSRNEYITKMIDFLKQYKNTFDMASEKQLSLWNDEFPEINLNLCFYTAILTVKKMNFTHHIITRKFIMIKKNVY